jgi:UDP-galactopyranose mutase
MDKYKTTNTPQYDYLIVGSGLFGAVFAHQATSRGKKCLVIDKRSHCGGNIYCQEKEGINIHQYGAHIFHTSNKEVWNYVNSITEFNRYTNSPIANYKGKLYNLPFNLNTFYQMWGCRTPQEAKLEIEKQIKSAREALQAQGVKDPRNLEEQARLLIGDDIYQALIKGYTEKQWGRPCTELPPFIIRRLPVRMTFDNNYFNDSYQGIPHGGYNKLIDTFLKGSDIQLNCNFFKHRDELKQLADKIVFTGAIDEYYNYCYGKLEYRTVHFETEKIHVANYQGNAVVNYTEREVPYTRIIEHKHFEMFGDEVYKLPHTYISREFSSEWHEGAEPYYPVNDAKNNSLYDRYKKLATQETEVIFGGRLAEYKYYDMDDTIEKALLYFKENRL